MAAPHLHIVMYPWFALGHLIPYLQLSNKLAKKGHKISFFIPRKTQAKLEPFNLYPNLITFIPITVPHVDGLPLGAETTADVPYCLFPHIMTAMDLTENNIEHLLHDIKPSIVFFDFTHWMPNLTRRLGIKSIQYFIASPVTVGYNNSHERQQGIGGSNLTEVQLLVPPSGFPDSSIKLHIHEAREIALRRRWKFGGNVLFYERYYNGLIGSDALGFRTCREIEGPFVDYLGKEFGKPVLLSGIVIPETPTSALDKKWATWLGGFRAGSHLKPPMGFKSVEAALPDGFQERVEGKGIVEGGWIQQQLILEHPSIGCFVTHCGRGSLSEALVNQCQLVLLPHEGDHIFNARLMSNNLKIGVEVEKGEEDGLFTKESVCKAVRTVMDDDNEAGREVRTNKTKLRQLLLSNNLETSYIDTFCEKLQALLK
ncbi:Glycosyltransferase [Quillaja saponaria]|uniref:Glycosyltransferase n=1 Tax=Quillaja saponaria TaxID=32244 RepID=A0AAD7VMW1_QUISA|nr:Glycosyltransferase [Quillaja saponaria]